ncbi:MAG: hypothetical protein KIS83_03240 [Rubrivivax sp.]|nr:hypothetical protein [Rubrivivax sp.]
MTRRAEIVLARVLRVLRPLVRLLLRHGVTYTALAAALKPLFVAAAREELQRQGMATTDSALTLLSGVHRHDVRALRLAAPAAEAPPPPLGLAAEVVARWLADPLFVDADGQPRVLARGRPGDRGEPDGFDALVAAVSSDVRARAVLDELLRLGVVHETADGIRLDPGGFAPQQGFEEMAWLFADNLHDHAAAAVANLQGDGRFLEQAVFVDHITEASAAALQREAVQVWRAAMRRVLAAAQLRYDADAAQVAPAERRQRARFGVYFFSGPEEPAAPPPAGPDAPTSPDPSVAKPRP